ncbi:MAG: HD domain-containing phosphohydrolase [Armatimonadota bacterium]
MIAESEILNASILIVDNEISSILLLDHLLRNAGYTSITSTINPLEVCELHLKNAYDLILLDLNMPGMDGFQVMECLKKIEISDYLPVLAITVEPDHKIRALKTGAKDFISKPFDIVEVEARVHNMLEVRLLHMETKTYSNELENLNCNLENLVNMKVKEIADAQLATILVLSKLAEARDVETGKHLERTREFCRLIAQQLNTQPEYAEVIDNAFIDNIFHASPLHDIGKVAIKDEILLKPGKLTIDEFEIMKTHTLHGAATLQSVHDQYPENYFIKMGIQVARSHHEKWDGSGYPDSLSRNSIPLSAQIMMLADVYDALRSKRCYKEPFSQEQSCEIIIDGRGRHFSPAIVDAFILLQFEFNDIYSKMID